MLGLYLKGSVPEAMLDSHRGPLEKAIAELGQEQERLAKHLEEVTVSPEQLDAIVEFCSAVYAGIELITDEYWTEKKKQVYELLNVQATLTVEDGTKVAYTRCIVGNSRVSIDPDPILLASPG